MADRPDPPEELPATYASGLTVQDDETLRETKAWLEELLAYRAQPVQADELPDDGEPIEDDDSGKGTLVKEKVTCGDETCHCADGELHGPYVYRYYRKGGKLKSKYVGKPGDV